MSLRECDTARGLSPRAVAVCSGRTPASRGECTRIGRPCGKYILPGHASRVRPGQGKPRSGGLTLPLIGALLEHGDAAMTASYAHRVESSRQRAAESVSGARAAVLAAALAPTLHGPQVHDAGSGTVVRLERRA